MLDQRQRKQHRDMHLVQKREADHQPRHLEIRIPIIIVSGPSRETQSWWSCVCGDKNVKFVVCLGAVRVRNVVLPVRVRVLVEQRDPQRTEAVHNHKPCHWFRGPSSPYTNHEQIVGCAGCISHCAPHPGPARVQNLQSTVPRNRTRNIHSYSNNQLGSSPPAKLWQNTMYVFWLPGYIRASTCTHGRKCATL